jgi:non-heme chloroperoxidase
MSTMTTKDGVTIFYKDWGSGTPIVFSHGWPLSSDDWDAQLMVKTPSNPGGLAKDVFDGLQAQVAEHRSQFYLDLPTGPFYDKQRSAGVYQELMTQ